VSVAFRRLLADGCGKSRVHGKPESNRADFQTLGLESFIYGPLDTLDAAAGGPDSISNTD